MIYEVLQIVADEVNHYLESLELDRSVQLDNIAVIEQDPSDSTMDMSDKVVLTMINMDEEKTLRNFPNRKLEENQYNYSNSKVNLNLYILFSANRNSYIKSLKDISKIVEFFQGKHLFTQSNSQYDRFSSAMSAVKDFRFTVELYTPTFEELNYIWGTLGGKQYPSALYKITLVEIERDVTAGISRPISATGLFTRQLDQP